MPRCVCLHPGDTHVEVVADEESTFPCMTPWCTCADYDPELVG
jgi:hypothetical protein